MSHDHKECSPSRVAKYQAKRKPRCNGGPGCKRCWDKWATVHRLAAIITPGIFKPYVEQEARHATR